MVKRFEDPQSATGVSALRVKLSALFLFCSIICISVGWVLNRSAREGYLAFKELKDAKNEAVSIAKAKSDFLATMSYEIRTSMNGIIGMAAFVGKPSRRENLGHVVSLRKNNNAGNGLILIGAS